MDTPKSSDRGLRRFEKVDGIGGRGWADVAESSLATEPALWLTLRAAAGPDGCYEVPTPAAGACACGPMATVQLSLAAAQDIVDQLEFLIANHYQVTG